MFETYFLITQTSNKPGLDSSPLGLASGGVSRSTDPESTRESRMAEVAVVSSRLGAVPAVVRSVRPEHKLRDNDVSTLTTR
jgi:hypothetical protein